MAKKNILNCKRVSFVCISVEEGQILLRCSKNLYECWTKADGCCDMLHQFGVSKRYSIDCADMTMKEFIRLVMDNYFNGNIFFQES